MRGLHLVAILLVLVREHATLPTCTGEFNVTDVSLPQDRPVTVGFSPKPSIQENVTYEWIIIFLKTNEWLNKEQCLEQYNMTVEEHGSTLRISWIPMKIDVRIKVMRDGESQCYKDARLSVLEKPSEPILGQLRDSGLDGCDRCLFLPHKEQHPTILCDVKGGALPLNVTMFIDTRAYTPNISSRDYKLTVDRAELQHRSDVRCEVMSPALVEPLIATAQVYIEVPPKNVTLTLNDVTIGQTGTVRCESKGMRPAVNITTHLDGRQCVSNRTVIHENRNDTYDVTTTLECLGTKSLNRKRIKCCMRNEQICSSEKYINVLFPPDTVRANQSVLVSGQSNVTVRCFVSEANPSCDINWRVPDRIQRLITERQLDNTAGDLDGRYAQISELFLQRNSEHNGQQIACTVKCGNFDVIEETVTLDIPGPPLITITPGIRITRTEGDALQLNCTVNSHLSTKTQWSFYGNKSCNNIPCNEVGKSLEDRSVECGTYSRCFDFESLARSDTGFYACVVETEEFGSTKQHVALEVISPELQSAGTVDDILKQAWFVPTTIGIAILLVLLLVIGIVVWRTRKRARKLDEPKGGADGQEDGPPIEENEGRVHEEGEQDVLQVGSNHGDGQMYASVVPRSQRQQQANQNERPNPGSDQSVHQGASNHGDGQMYASVLPRSQRQQQANQNEVQPSGSNQLVYVELDFQPTKPASKPEAGSHVESNATDYVSIDFNKTAQVNSGSDKTPYMNM